MTTKAKQIKTKDGVTIFYNISKYSNKYCLILLHGVGGDLNAWKPIKNEFDYEKISTISVDLRGHGYSSSPKDKGLYSIEQFGEDILEIINKEKFNKYFLVGHSLGGMISIWLAEKYPNLVSGIVLIDTYYKMPGHWIKSRSKKIIFKVLDFIRKISPSFKIRSHVNFKKFSKGPEINIKRWISDLYHTSLKNWLSTIEGIMKFDASKSISQLNLPVLILSGETDSLFLVKDELNLSKKIKGSELTILPGLSHISIIEDPKTISSNIVNFLKKIF